MIAHPVEKYRLALGSAMYYTELSRGVVFLLTLFCLWVYGVSQTPCD